MDEKSKTVKILLIDGEPDGLRRAELGTWIGKAFVIPRKKLQDMRNQPDCNKPAVYFLIGKEKEGGSRLTAYIGESENLHSRLIVQDNVRNKDFQDIWHIAIAFVSKDKTLTKTGAKYLESQCLEIAKQVEKQTDRFDLMNRKGSSKPSLPEFDRVILDEFLDNLKFLLTAVGYPLLQEITSEKAGGDTSNHLFICRSSKAEARGCMTNDGFVVYKESTAAAKPVDSFKEKFQKEVTNLKAIGCLKYKDENHYVFVKNHVFSSPSRASSIVLGRNSNGRDDWETKEGKRLGEIYCNEN